MGFSRCGLHDACPVLIAGVLRCFILLCMIVAKNELKVSSVCI